MKNRLLLIFGLSVTLAAKAQNTFQFMGNGTSNSTVKQIFSIESANSGGFFLTGRSNLSVNVFEFFTAKYDSSGQPVWVKKMDPTLNFFPNSVFKTNDGGCLVLGYSYDSSIPSHFSQLVRFDSIGSVLWNSDLMNPSYSFLNANTAPFHLACVEKPSGGFFILMNLSNDSIHLINTDGGGNIIWVKEFSDGFNFNFSLSFNSAKDKLIMSCLTNPFNPDNTIACFDTLGQIIWAKQLTLVPRFDVLLATPDDKIYTAGADRLRQFDSTGTLIWEKKYRLTGADSADPISIMDFHLLNDTEIVAIAIVGMLYDVLIMRINIQGNVSKTLRIPLEVHVMGPSAYPRIRSTSDNKVLFTSLHDSLPNSYLFKMDPAFPVGAVCNSTQPQVSATLVQPNITQIHYLNTVSNSPYAVLNFPFVVTGTTLPFDDYCPVASLPENLVPDKIIVTPNPVESGQPFTLQFGEPFTGEITIYDINGRKAATYTTTGTTDFHLETNKFGSGIYLITGTDRKNTFTTKLVIK